MELQEKVTALETEKTHYLQTINTLSAEKLALDNMVMEALKAGLEHRKNSILKDGIINDLNNQIKVLKTENDSLKKDLHCKASEAQSIE